MMVSHILLPCQDGFFMNASIFRAALTKEGLLNLRWRKTIVTSLVYYEVKMKETLKHTTVAQFLWFFPDARREFIRRGLSCVGCAFEAFCTLEDVERIYQIDLDTWILRWLRSSHFDDEEKR